jgi:hypothetical protein
MFGRVPGWKPAAGDVPVEAVKITPRPEDGGFKVRVTVLKGKFLEIEQPVGDYPISEDAKLTVTDLTKFGVVPFEVSLVRAPATVANLPAVINKTRSIQVSVEPNLSTLPTFKLKLLNDSAKPVSAFTYETQIDGRRRLTGVPRGKEGAVFIAPGASYVQEITFPVNPTTTSTGEAPAAVPDLTVMVSSVVFSDGTYEGDTFQAARPRAFFVGEKIQLQRIVGVLSSYTPETSLDALNAQVSDLTYYLDEPAFERFAAGIPGLSEKDKDDFHDAAEVSSSDVQRSFVEEFGRKRMSTKDNPAEFQEWIKTSAERYKKWLNALPVQ